MADEADARPVRRMTKPARRKPSRAAVAQKPRAKRTKKTLGGDFLAAVRADFRAHGAGVIAEVRADKPDQYLKIVLSVLPRDFDAAVNHLDALSDEEIRSRIRSLETVLRPFLEDPADISEDGISGASGGA
ncbi:MULTISPECIES: hypothetical protein [Mesorhizobium]|uniref:hypothetical protein n=1 Tax=Mesorhizobium jarvisii TaxID=1777867 RepID=UPI00049A9D8F|nr:hypothetical protein [Mesorhizobium jarvisii]AID31157.1 hypothetical protein MCHK_3354 [Mesorhizobium huakuii 7653R]MCH4554886.1 hypothetical protein [Mesorhizobium jarvisii]